MSNSPSPGDTLIDEGGSTNCWLVSSWSLNDIRFEWDYMFCPYTPLADQLTEIWFRPRWTTSDELADEDFLYETFGDHDGHRCSIEVVYEQAKPRSPGAHRYWTSD